MLRFIPIVLFCIQLSAVANINYSAEAVDDQQSILTARIMNTIIEKCDDTETREEHYNCIANFVNKIIKANIEPASPIFWEQNPPREPGPDDVLKSINMEHPLVMVMPDRDRPARREPGPDEVPNDGPDGPIRKIPIGPAVPGSQSNNDLWPLF